jgi:CrcB protein
MSGLVITLGVGATGALGAAARYLIVEWIARWPVRRFPLATFLINITGAFALGFLTTAFASAAQFDMRLLLGVGFLGGYTTFSTLSYDTHSLYRSGQARAAWLNALGSLAIGLAAAALGIALGTLV